MWYLLSSTPLCWRTWLTRRIIHIILFVLLKQFCSISPERGSSKSKRWRSLKTSANNGAKLASICLLGLNRYLFLNFFCESLSHQPLHRVHRFCFTTFWYSQMMSATSLLFSLSSFFKSQTKESLLRLVHFIIVSWLLAVSSSGSLHFFFRLLNRARYVFAKKLISLLGPHIVGNSSVGSVLFDFGRFIEVEIVRNLLEILLLCERVHWQTEEENIESSTEKPSENPKWTNTGSSFGTGSSSWSKCGCF